VALRTPPTPGLTELRLLLSPTDWPTTLPTEPLPLAQAILSHLHRPNALKDLPKDTYSLPVDTWAGLSLLYRVA